MKNSSSACIIFYPSSEDESKLIIEWKRMLRILDITYKSRMLELVKCDTTKLKKESEEEVKDVKYS